MTGAAVRSALFGLLCLGLPATPAAAAPRDAGETIVIRERPPYAICGGFCPWFEARIGPGGAIESRTLGAGPGDTIVVHRIIRFRASSRRLAAFRRLPLQLRPDGERHADEICVRAKGQDGGPDPLDDPRPDDIAISWTGGSRPARFTACSRNWAVQDRVMRALRALGLQPGGDRI